MKITVISSTVFKCLPPSYAGLEVIAWWCAKGLADLGNQVTLVAPDGSECPGCEVIHTGPPGQHDEHAAFQRYWKHLYSQDCAIDHSWQKHAYTLKEEGSLRIPVLGVLHAPVNTMYGTLPAVDKPCFVCISHDQAAHFEALHGRPARVARNGVDVDFYRQLNVPRSRRYLFLARYSSIKGPDLALEACRAANVGLDMIGDTTITGEPELFARCQSMADSERRIMGGVSRGETVWWYSQAHCMLHPNKRFREPLGLAPLEAMACGTPVIAWRHGAMRETVVDKGGTGWLVDSMEQLVDCVRHAEIDDGMRKRCRDWVADNFTLQHMVAAYGKLCEEAVNGGW